MRALYDLLLWDDRYANRVRYALERGLGIDDGDDDQAEPQLDGPSKPAPAVDPWDGLDIPDSLRRDLPSKDAAA